MKKRIFAILLTVVMVMAMLPIGGVVAADETATTATDALTDEALLWSTLTNPDEDETGDVTLTVVTTKGETETYQYANIMDAVKKLFSYMNHGDNYQTTTSYSATTTWYNPNGRGYNWSGVDYTWDYTSAVISFTGEHCEYITTSVQFKSSTSGWQYASLNNVTFDGKGTGSIVGDPDQSWTGDVVVSGGSYGNAYGYGSYSNLKGTITISGNNCTIQNTSFVGNHTWAFTYYTQDNAIGVGSGVTDLTIKNNSFTGYTLVTAFGQSGGTVTDEVFDSNYVDGCLFLFHTADGGATNLTVTNNTLVGSAEYTLASCMAYTTLADFSGNTLKYASFGLQNCETDMEQFLEKNTYDHGYIYQETVDYSWTDEELENGTYYYLPSSTTVYTILPEGEYRAVWTSDYDEAGEMDSALTYTQQDAINAAVEAALEDASTASCEEITWTGGGRDEDGNLLDGGVAIGYNYNALHLGYAKVTEPGMDKTILVKETTTDEEGNETTVTVEKDQDDVAAGDTVDYKLTSTIPDTLAGHIDYVYDNGVAVGSVHVTETTTTGEDGNETTVSTPDKYTLVFHDDLAEGLTFDKDSLEVYIGTEKLSSSYYTVTSTNLSDGCTFEVSIELLVLYTNKIIDESDFGKTEIYVTYSATADDDITAGKYENTAWVTYDGTNSEKDVVEVDTYGISVFKYDQATATTDEDGNITATGLAGAEFTVYSDEDCKNKITTITTGTDGYATLDGLDAGTYYLVETKAPEGYVCSEEKITVTIEGGGDKATNIYSVSVANAAIPETGGAGTVIFTVAGAGIMAVAGVVLVISRRKHKDEE